MAAAALPRHFTPLESSRNAEKSVRTEPGATGAQTDGQQREDPNSSSDKRQAHQLLTALLTPGLDRLAAVQRKNPDAPT